MQAPKIDRPPVTTTTDHSELNDATHSVTDTEVEIFTSWINESCADSPEVAGRLPLDPKSRQLFSACKDSWLLVALIDNARPGLVEKSKMHMHGSIKSLNAFELAENANVVIDAARKLGIVVVNIGAEDITGGNQHLILGIIWQIVRGVLSKNLYVVMNPRILRLQKAGESFENLLRVTPEDTLLRWVNQTLSSRRSELKGQYRLVRNFGKDLQDGIVLIYMMQILYPEAGFEGLQLETDVRVRVTKLVELILTIGLKYITVDSIVSGNPRTNFAFLAQLFSVRPALAELSTAESQQFDAMLSVAKLDLDGLGGVVDLAAEQKRRMSIRSSVSRGDWQASARRQSFRDVLANEPGPVAKEREVERFWQRSPYDNVQPKPWMASWTPAPHIPQLDNPNAAAEAEAAERAAIRERERHAPITCQRCQQCRHSEAALGADSHSGEAERQASTDSCEHDEDDGSDSSQDASADASAESLDATSRGVGTTPKGDASAAAKALMEVAEKLKHDEKKASKKARRHARLVEARRQREAEAAAEEEARQAAKAQKAAAKEEERRAEEARHAEARRQREAEEEAKAAEAAAEHEARLAAKAQKAAAKEEERRAEEARQAAKAAAKEEERLAEEARLAAKAAAKDEERRAEEERLAAKAAAKEEARRAEEARQAAKAAAREQETAGEREARLTRKAAKQAARLQESVAEEEARLAAKAAKAAARDAARQREREEEEARAAAKQAQKDGARSSDLQEAVAAEEARQAAKAAKAAAKLQEEEARRAAKLQDEGARRAAKLQEEEARRAAKLQEEEQRRAAKEAKAAEREASRSQELQEAAAAEEARLAAKEARRAAKDAKAAEREASRSQELQEAAAAEEERLAAKEARRREQEEEAAAYAASRAAALEAKSRLEAELEALRQAKRAAEAALKEQEDAARKAAKEQEEAARKAAKEQEDAARKAAKEQEEAARKAAKSARSVAGAADREQEEAARKAAKSTRSVAAAADRAATDRSPAADRPAPAIEATSTESLADQAVAATWGPGGSAGGDPLERESLAAAWGELKRREQALASERALFEQEKATFTKEVETRRAAWSVIKTVTTTIHYLDDSCGECRERVRAQQRTQEQQAAVTI
ncbi:hypothetical protein HDU89_003103 [Geranomyces variabilis]|nr:hypothetical protein HDU89_003103 [Geranomyces variabilis]